eukprot:COSAG06_NODE_2656_length_6487_cov_109.872260_9_plen_74_part_00
MHVFAQSHYLEYIFMGMAISGNLIDGIDGIVLIAMIVDYYMNILNDYGFAQSHYLEYICNLKAWPSVAILLVG